MFSVRAFLDKINRLADEFDMFPDDGIILLGVSGGADSMCLLDALLELSQRGSFSVVAAHFNHELRGDESDLDESFVIKECKELGVEVVADRADVISYASENSLGKVAAARELRYAFFQSAADELSASNDCKTVRIATAHNADDLAETVVINLTRGAGLPGLSGIPPARDSIVRPMLHVSRNEIMEYIKIRGVKYVEDSSNRLQNQVRNRIRHSVIPVLQEINPRFTESIVRTTQLIRLDEQFLTNLASEHSDTNNLSVNKMTSLDYPIKSRLIRAMGSNALTNEHINSVIELSESSNPSGRLSLPNLIVYREYDKLIFKKTKNSSESVPKTCRLQTKIEEFPLTIGDEFSIPESGVTVRLSEVDYSENIPDKTFSTFLFQIDEICGTIFVGSRREGDSVKILGSNQTKSLKKLFIEKHIPAAKRGLVPIIYDELGVLAVHGICRSNRAIPKAGTKALKIELN